MLITIHTNQGKISSSGWWGSMWAFGEPVLTPVFIDNDRCLEFRLWSYGLADLQVDYL